MLHSKANDLDNNEDVYLMNTQMLSGSVNKTPCNQKDKTSPILLPELLSPLSGKTRK